MAQDFPVVFTIGNSSRHEVILINPGYSIQDISSRVESLAVSSANCAETLAKYKKKGEAEKVTEIRVRWASEGRDSKLFPKTTILTDDNIEAILHLIGQNRGKDVLEVDMQAPQSSSSEESKEESKE